MTADETRKGPLPSHVGEDSRRFKVIRDEHLGSGSFGDVYMGKCVSNGEKVAIKLDHRSGSIARNEWEVMKRMDGDGTPKVHYTGYSGSYFVMVMELLGPTLQCLLESRTCSPPGLSWNTVSTIGNKCIRLLQKLHSKGYVHGDVKPENFLCARTNSKRIDPSRGIYMIDLGLASKWRDYSKPSGHIDYGQRLEHFSGTVRYASVNTHLGRLLSRRDDLESLGYMLLYLVKGKLPWQGYTGDDKDMQVCEKKGNLIIDANVHPSVLEYFLAYVRELKFDEAPDYDYLSFLCSDNIKGMRAVNNLLNTAERENDPTNSLNYVTRGSAGKGNNNKERTLGPSVGSKRKTRDMDWMVQPLNKKHKVVLPKRMKAYAWIIVSTSAHTAWGPQAQCYTSHTTCDNLLKEVKRKWPQGMRITTLSFAQKMWTALLDPKSTEYTEQVLHYCQDSDFPHDWVRKQWGESYYITSVAGNENCWGIVCSKMRRDRSFKKQSYIVSSTFPSKWIADKWNANYFITAIATQGRFSMQWCVIMSRGASYKEQCVELDFQYPSPAVHARWDGNYNITAAACTEEQCALVLSRGHTSGEGQRCTRTPNGPLPKIREDWNKSLYVTCLTYGRVS